MKYQEMTSQEQAIWNAAFGTACANEFQTMYSHSGNMTRSFESIIGNRELAWEIADRAVEAHRKWKQELIDLKDERVI